jgi:hypothetical protein
VSNADYKTVQLQFVIGSYVTGATVRCSGWCAGTCTTLNDQSTKAFLGEWQHVSRNAGLHDPIRSNFSPVLPHVSDIPAEAQVGHAGWDVQHHFLKVMKVNPLTKRICRTGQSRCVV